MRRAARQARSRVVTIPVGTHGLVESRATAAPDMQSAVVMENWIPTRRGARVRGGSPKVATVGAAVTSLFAYQGSSTEKIFAATASAVYDISALDSATVPAPSISGQASGYYGTQMMGTSGGEFLVIANGDDFVWYYDGGNFNPITSVAVSNLAYDALTADFTAGETVTGGTSGASATILAVIPATATTGTLKLGTITGGPFQDNEALTSAAGAATANGASASASGITITNVSTDALSAPWQFANRLFFVETGTQSAWYLPVDSIGGAAAEFPLSGVFKRGGALFFGGSWSMDAGDGMDDKCVFVSTNGEVAIYAGTDPSSSADWVLQGRYDIGKPLGINGTMQAGGDFLIATEDGIVPLSQVIMKDPAALSLAAVTRPIERLWAYEVSQNTGSIELVKWVDNGLGLVVLPQAERALIVNLQTGAWCVATGWDMDCATTHAGRAFGGFDDGFIRALDEGGNDAGAGFTARYCHAFDGYGSAAQHKQPSMIRVAFYAAEPFTYEATMAFDYDPTFPAAPPPAAISLDSVYLVWDQGNWNEKLWYSEDIASLSVGFFASWRSVYGSGTTMAPMVQVTSNGSTKLLVEMVQIDISLEDGGAIV